MRVRSEGSGWSDGRQREDMGTFLEETACGWELLLYRRARILYFRTHGQILEDRDGRGEDKGRWGSEEDWPK